MSNFKIDLVLFNKSLLLDVHLTTKQAVKRLKITPRRVQAVIEAKRLPAQKFGRDYMIREKDLKLVENRKVGRPKKTEKIISLGD